VNTGTKMLPNGATTSQNQSRQWLRVINPRCRYSSP